MAETNKKQYAIGNGDMYDGAGQAANLIDEIRSVGGLFAQDFKEHIMGEIIQAANAYTDQQCASLKDRLTTDIAQSANAYSDQKYAELKAWVESQLPVVPAT